jgi:uncharacterized protein
MAEHYYIDGYNVLHQSSSLRPLVEEDFETAREALINRVADFCIAIGKRVTLVFDGQSMQVAEREANTRGVVGMEIYYTPAGLTADSYIERSVYQKARRMEVVVVTNDQGMRDLCRGMGALVMESDNFLASAREARQETAATLATTRRSPQGAHLEDRLDTNSLSQLEAWRKRLEK